MDPEVRRARQNALCEGQDAFYVHFFELGGVPVHLHERELLAQLVAMPVVPLDVDRSLVEERLVQTVELFLNRLLLVLDLDNPLLRVRLQISPRVKHAILHEPHEAGGWLQSGELGDEHFF